jgi:hypothetical protein
MRTSILGAAVGAAFLASAAGCGLDHDFEIRRTVSVDSTGGSTVEAVDLKAIAGDAWSERGKIKDVEIRSATATIISVGAGNTAPTGSGTASLRRTASPTDEVTFAQATGLPIAVGQQYSAVDLGPLAGVVKRALKSDGQLEIDADGVADSGVAQFDTEIAIKVRVTFGMF